METTQPQFSEPSRKQRDPLQAGGFRIAEQQVLFCMAWPDAPFTRLSSAEPIIARSGIRSDTTPMNFMLEPRTCRAIEAPNRSRVYA